MDLKRPKHSPFALSTVTAGVLLLAAAASAERPAPALADLRGMADLAARFDAARGRPRLVLLLSPT